MKKLLFVLLLAAAGEKLSAQIDYYFNPPPSSEIIFNSPGAGTSRSRLVFMLPAGNKMIIELNDIQWLNRVPDLDSVFRKIATDLEPLKDSLSDPLMIRRIDYINYTNDTKIRIRQQRPESNYFSYKDDELVQMKVDQDTIIFRGHAPAATKLIISGEERSGFIPYTVTLVLNNISDLEKLPDGLLNSALELAKKDLDPRLKKVSKNSNFNNYHAIYDVQKQKRITPRDPAQLAYGKKSGFKPYVQLGVQYGLGTWIPSVAVGVEVFYNKNKTTESAFRLIWEPYFFFQRNTENKLVTDRNDFITVRYYNSYKFFSSVHKAPIESVVNFSLGYLINKNGNWFEQTTFKFTVPGLQTKNILLEPEFFFNNFFQNFSPSIKLTMFLD